MICSVFGHRNCALDRAEQEELQELFKYLVEEERVYEYWFGSRSKFDDICHVAVTELMSEHPQIVRVANDCGSEDSFLIKEKE